MNRTRPLSLWLLLAALPAVAQAPVPNKNTPPVRGKPQAIYFYPGAAAEHPEAKPIVIFACGDGGWRGFSITIAETIASWGYDTFGFDSKTYLESFTGKTPLKESEVTGDFGAVIEWVRAGRARPVVLVGWSEGAGLALLGAAGPANRDLLAGFVAIGLPDRNILAWHWYDAVTWITKKDPNEPGFESAPYMPKVAPLPLLMINSTRDEYQSAETYQQLFQLAGERKRMVSVNAKDHRFDGNHDGFFAALREGLQWILEKRPSQPKGP